MKFKSDIEVQAGIRDSSGAIGTSGQVLSSTGSNVSWINQTTVASDVQNLVKAGVAINKGQAVYVTGADGTNIIVGLASNTSEATSSKTLGLLNATVAVNGFADVVQIGRLAGLNTIGATAGDPVWLGTNGNLIYGLINKPYAPAHLVFLGIVTRVNANNGEIFVNVQNGFELKEIHDVDIITNVPINGDVLGYDGTLWVNKTIAEWLGYTPANANGTTNYVSKFTGATTLGNSQIFDNGSGVGIGTTSPTFVTTGTTVLDVNGSTGAAIYLRANIAQGSYLRQTSNNLVIGNNTYGDIIYNTGFTEAMRITADRLVGIGTTSPNSLLQVGSSNFVITDRTSAVYGPESQTIFTVGRSGVDYPQLLNFGVNQAGLYSSISARQFTVSTENNLVLQPNGGNVGIGTTSPSEKLQIYSSSNTAFSVVDSASSIRMITAGGINFFQSGPVGGGASPLVFSSMFGGLEYMRITSSGNVGIGTTSPVDKLEVNGGIRSTGLNGFTRINDGVLSASRADGLYLIQEANAPMIMWTNNTERMRITSSGNVGIGTTSTFSKVEIAGAATSWANSPAITFTDNAGTVNSRRWLIGNVATDYGSLNFAVSTTNSDNPTNPKMTITKEGNVGIGTTAPQAKLHINNGADRNLWFRVNGSGTGTELLSINDAQSTRQSLAFSASSFYFDNGNVGIGTTSPAYKLVVQKTDIATPAIMIGGGFYGGPRLQVYGLDDNATAWMGLGTDMSGGIYEHSIYFPNASGNGRLSIGNYNGTTYSEKMCVINSGNVGIGTTAPSEKLDVYGVIRGVYTADPGAGAVTGKFLAYSPAAYGLVFRGYNTGAHSIQVQREANNAEIYPLSLQPNGGNVGIGTISPSEKLDVSVTRSYNQSADIGIALGGTDNGFVDNFSTSSWRQFVLGNASGQSLKFDGFVRSVGWVERMRITSSGNVGINTTAPIHKLSVNGKIGGDVWSAGYIEFLSTTETVISAESNVVLGYAQNVVVDNEGSLGVGTISPAACAIVDIQSTNQGFLPPRMRTSERDNILGTPKPGLMIFNTDDEVIQVYTDGSGWRTLAFL